MQVIPAGEYNSYDVKNRNPNMKVYVQRNYDSIPFDGKSMHTTTSSERYPKHILHTDGRLCMVYSKYNSSTLKWDLYFKTTNTDRTIWNSAVEIQQDGIYDYLNPAIIQINSSNNLGIIVSRNGTDLFSCVVDTSGVIQSALADTTVNGTSPSLTKISTTYWMAYEDSGVIYYRTSADFSSWSAATNLNTETGLSNDHFNPYIYYDTSNVLWVTFERVTDAAANPVVKNIYTMLSNNDGGAWDSPVAQTSLVAGEGSALKSSIIDTTAHRYINYTVERQIQNLDYGAHTFNCQYYDVTNNRIFYGTGTEIVIYDVSGGTYSSYDSTDNPSIINVTSIFFDSSNNTIVAGTSANGIIIYNEDTTVWTNYNTGTIPAISNDKILAINVELGKIYVASGNSTTCYLQMINIVADTVSNFADNLTVPSSIFYSMQIFLESTRILCIGQSAFDYPNRWVIGYFTKSDLTTQFTQTGLGTARYTPYQVALASRVMKIGYDTDSRILYIPSEDTDESFDFGIALHTVTDSSATFAEYWTNEADNAYGLLPNPLSGSYQYQYIVELHYNSVNKRLYIMSGETITVSYLSVINTTTKLAIEHYAPVGDSRYVANFSEIDANLIKVFIGKNSYGSFGLIADDNKRVYIILLNTRAQIIVYTESIEQRVYYRRTSDDSSWTAEAYLTTNSKDTNCNLGYSDSRLKAFWDRNVSGTYKIKWDEDLSTEVNISEYVESANRFMTIENEANNCDVILSDKSGLFNPLNLNSLSYDYLNENNIIRIEKGNNGNYIPYFYGLIGAGDADIVRGDGIFYKITVWGKSKNYYKNKVTTELYQNKTVTFIAEDLAANYMNLSGGEYSFPTINTIIPQVQFIEEAPMDILRKIFQIDNYYPDFDEEGLLIAKLINYEASIDFTYYEDGTDSIAANKAPAMNINSINFSWDDNQLINKVTVIGQEEATGEEEFPEEFMGFINGVAGWFSKRNQFEFYYSGDKQLQATQPRIVVQDSCGNKFFGGGESVDVEGGDFSVKKNHCIINQNVSNLIAAIFILIAAAQVWLILSGGGVGAVWVYNGLATVVALGYTFLGQIGSYYYEIYAKPIGEPIPDTIVAVAQDNELIEKYNGENEFEIDNPLLSTYIKCINLAENELEKAKWFRYNVRLNIMANLAVQTGDVISVYNPTFNLTHKIYVRDTSNLYSRGNPDMDEITGALIL